MALIVIEVFIWSSGMSREQRPHVSQVSDRDADLADLAASQLVVRVVAGLRRQVEGDRQPGLALGTGCVGTARWTPAADEWPA